MPCVISAERLYAANIDSERLTLMGFRSIPHNTAEINPLMFSASIDSADALHPVNSSPSSLKAEEGVVGSPDAGELQLVQTGLPAFMLGFPIDVDYQDLYGLESSWIGGGQNWSALVHDTVDCQISLWARPTPPQLILATVNGYITWIYSWITGTTTIISTGYYPLDLYLSPEPPTLKFHQVQGLDWLEREVVATALDPLRDPISDPIPGIVPGLWSQPDGYGAGSSGVSKEHNIFISSVSLEGGTGGVCNTVMETPLCKGGKDTGEVGISVAGLRDGSYEVDIEIITISELDGAGGRVAVSISGLPSIDHANSVGGLIRFREEHAVTRTISVSGTTSDAFFTWTPTLKFVPGSLGKKVSVKGYFAITDVRRTGS